MATLVLPPATPPDPDSRHWTPQSQRAFLEALAATGSITRAALAASKSPRAARDLRMRRDGAAFRIGWEAALLIARAALADSLMERAIDGQEDVVVRDGDTLTRRRHDNRLGMSLLSRLDRMAETDLAAGTDGALARLVSQDFEAFLDLVERGGTGAEAALFVAARSEPEPAEMLPNEQCEVAPPPDAIPDPEAFAAALRVWRAGDGVVVTNFPPPPGFEGYSEGWFGDPAYQRTLTDEETDVVISPLRAAAEAARDDWFGFVPEDVDEGPEADDESRVDAEDGDEDEDEDAWSSRAPDRHAGLDPAPTCLGKVDPGAMAGATDTVVASNPVRAELVEALPAFSAQSEEQGTASTGSARTDEEGAILLDHPRPSTKGEASYANGRPPNWLLEANRAQGWI